MRTWEQIVSQHPFYTEGYFVLGLMRGAPGLLALTHGFAEMSGGVWLWTAEGSRAEVTDALPATSAGAEFYDAAWADGQFVVVGHGSDGGASDASAWSSSFLLLRARVSASVLGGSSGLVRVGALLHEHEQEPIPQKCPGRHSPRAQSHHVAI